MNNFRFLKCDLKWTWCWCLSSPVYLDLSTRALSASWHKNNVLGAQIHPSACLWDVGNIRFSIDIVLYLCPNGISLMLCKWGAACRSDDIWGISGIRWHMCLFNSELILVVHTALIICELEITCGLVFAKNVRLCVVCGALHFLGICELILTSDVWGGLGTWTIC